MASSFTDKIFDFFEQKYLTNSDFKKELQSIRKKIGIPLNGYSNFEDYNKKASLLDERSDSIFTIWDGKESFRDMTKKEALAKGLEKEFEINEVYNNPFGNNLSSKLFSKKHQIPKRYGCDLYDYLFLGKKKCFETWQKETGAYDKGFGCDYYNVHPKFFEDTVPWVVGKNMLEHLKKSVDDDLVAVVLIYPEASKEDIKRLIKKNRNNPSTQGMEYAIEEESGYKIKSPRTKRAMKKHLKMLELKKQGKSSREISIEILGSDTRGDIVRNALRKFK